MNLAFYIQIIAYKPEPTHFSLSQSYPYNIAFHMDPKVLIFFNAGVTITFNEYKLLLQKMNSMDDKLAAVLRKVNKLTNKSTATFDATEDDAPSLPSGISLPIDSIRGLTDLSNKMNRDAEAKRQMVVFFIYFIKQKSCNVLDTDICF